MHHECCRGCGGGHRAPSSESTRKFAQALLGKPVSGAGRTEINARKKREQLEWLSAISPEHERRLRQLMHEEAKAQARAEQLEWLASISTVN